MKLMKSAAIAAIPARNVMYSNRLIIENESLNGNRRLYSIIYQKLPL